MQLEEKGSTAAAANLLMIENHALVLRQLLELGLFREFSDRIENARILEVFEISQYGSVEPLRLRPHIGLSPRH